MIQKVKESTDKQITCFLSENKMNLKIDRWFKEYFGKLFSLLLLLLLSLHLYSESHFPDSCYYKRLQTL